MKQIFLLILLFVGICTQTLPAEDTQPHIEHLRIQKIEVTVKQQENQTEQEVILTRLKTKQGALFSQEDFDEDLKTLAKEYDRIDPQIQITSSGLDINLYIWPKPKIEKITWEGNKEIEEKKLLNELGIRPGTIFDRPAFNKAFHKLKNYYIRKGYFEAELDYSVAATDTSNAVDITIHIREGRSGEIDEIVFHNLTKKEEEQLLDLIFTKEYNFFTSWLTNEGTHNPEVLKADEMTCLTFIQNEGYADAKIRTQILEAKKKGRIIVDIDVEKGPLYHTNEITIEGNTIFTLDELLGIMPLKKAVVYSPETVRKSVKALQDAYGKRGYIDTIVTAEAQPVEGESAYNVSFHIRENERFRVGLIKVFGNKRTDTSVILHEVLLVPGDVFDSTVLSKSEERLRNVGYFKNVNIYAVKSSQVEAKNSHFRDVYVEVEENPTTARFSSFAGFSTTESVFGGITCNETNFNYKGLASLFSKGFKGLRGGGEYVGLSAIFGKKQLSYNLSWTKPYFMDTPWIVGFDANKMRNSYAANDYTINAYGVQLFAHYPINAFVKVGMQYRLRHSFITLKGISHRARNEQLIHESRNGGLISALGPILTYDSTDHPQLPRRGVRSTLTGEYAGFQGDHQFLKATYLNSLYWAPYEYGLVRLRGNLQFIQTLGSTHPKDLPLDERFYIGGEQSLRGYRYNTVGPKFHDINHTPRGGMSSVLFSCDYDQYLFKRLDAYVFFDAGNVYFRQLDLGALRYTAGYGLKVKILGNAPLVFGMGYPLNPQSKRDVKHFFFSIGAAF